MTILGFEVALEPLGLGAVVGLTYALLAVGLVLALRSSGIINFAHGEIGAFGAVLLWFITAEFGVPYWVAFVVGIAVAALVAAAVERAIIRRLLRAPRVVGAIATLGVGQFLIVTSGTLVPGRPRLYPEPSGIPQLHLGTLLLRPSYVVALVLAPMVIAGLALFLRRHPTGLAMRASAEDPDLARTAGFPAGKLLASTWALSGALAAITAILLVPTEVGVEPAMGFDLLLKALAAAALAHFRNLVGAALAGLGIGLAEQLVFWNEPQGNLMSLLLFAAIYVALLFRRRTPIGRQDASWLGVHVMHGGARWGWALGPIVTIGLAAVLVWLLPPTGAATVTSIVSLAIVGMSVTLTTGAAGQLSLGQMAFAAIGAATSIAITVRTGNFFLGFAGAAVAAAVAALGVGLPALRRRDLSMAVVTLAFAFAATHWLLGQPWLLGEGRTPGRPIIGPLALTTARSYALFAMGVLLVVWLAMRWVWRSPLRRRLVAQRDHDAAARAVGLSTGRIRAQGLLVAGAIAGVGGALFAHGLFFVQAQSFPVADGVEAVGAATIGGLSAAGGSILGAAYILGLPELARGPGAVAAAWAGWTLLLVIAPGGLIQAVGHLRRRVVRRRRTGRATVPSPGQRAAPDGLAPTLGTEPSTGAVLEVLGASVTFGTVRALTAVSLSVGRGEIVGVAGPNGAGKSTLVDLVSGFLPRSDGRVLLDGEEISRFTPQVRARLGVIRSFEEPVLFPTLTLGESVQLALERDVPWFAPSGLRAARSREFLQRVGLGGLFGVSFDELSTGLRRIGQLACVLAARPRLLLLDEPASGIARGEVDALVNVLQAIHRQLGISMLIVEHDMDFLARLAARIYLLDQGRVVASGPPRELKGSIRG